MKRREFIRLGTAAVAGVGLNAESFGAAGQGERNNRKKEVRERAQNPQVKITTKAEDYFEDELKDVLDDIATTLKNLQRGTEPEPALLLNEGHLSEVGNIVKYSEVNPQKNGANRNERSVATVNTAVMKDGKLFVFGSNFLPAGEGAKSGFAIVSKGDSLNVQLFFEKFHTTDSNYDKEALSPGEYEERYRTMAVWAGELKKYFESRLRMDQKNQEIERLSKLFVSLEKNLKKIKFS